MITGPNGGGKSTLAKVLIGIEKAESGKIFLNGEDITDYDINHRANAGIGYAFQQPPRFKGMTVQRLLALAAGREMSDVECCKLLSDVGLCAEEYLNRQIDGTLSGGEMKRIEIATVLAKEHTLCIFDEPEVLIDHPHPPAEQRNAAGLDVAQVEAVDDCAASGDGFLGGEQFQDGGLAGAGGADQEDELPVVHQEGDAFDGVGAVVVYFIDVGKAYHSLSCDSNGKFTFFLSIP